MVFSYLSFLTFCSCIVMGIIGLLLDPASGKNRSFAFFSFVVSIWAFGDIFYYISKDQASGWFWYKLTSIGWCGMVYGLFYICMEFADYYKKIPLFVKFIIFIYSLALIITQFNGKLFLRNFNITPYGPIEDIDIFSIGFLLLYGGMLLSVLTGTFFVVKTMIKNQSFRIRKMLRDFLIVFYSSYLIGVCLNVVQVFFEKPLQPFGSIFMLLFLSGILYLMKRYSILRLDFSNIRNETVNAISDMLLIISPEKKIIKINDTAKDIIKLMTEDISEIFYYKKEFEGYIAEAISGKKKVIKKHILIKGINGEIIPVYLSICPVFDKFEDYIGSILICKILSDFDKISDNYKISNQERKIIIYLMQGLFNKEISLKMNISESTVKNYITNIYQKTKVSNKIELMRLFFIIDN